MTSPRQRVRPASSGSSLAPHLAEGADGGWSRIVAVVVLILVTVFAYANSHTGPFVFDDQAAILQNPSIRHLTDLGAIFSPPGEGFTVDGRPILNFSLAVNYAISGTSPGSYHGLNLVIHLLAALTLFGLVRRTLVRNGRPSGSGAADPRGRAWEPVIGALAVSLVWAVHPLQTESVTYVIQRAESLMGLFYFLTLYGFVRAAELTSAQGASRWYVVSWLACFLGMGTKEVMVSAPLMVFVFDGVFFSDGWRDALRRRGKYYGWLALTLGVLVVLALRTGSRGGTSGFGLEVTPWMYWQTQFQAVAHYLWLSFWPGTLIFDYGVQWTSSFAEVVPYALLVAGLVVAVGRSLWRREAAGFLGLFFFAILAPTSIVPGNRQTLSEHRMYVALAAVIVFVVCGIYRLIPDARRSKFLAMSWLPLSLIVLPLAVLTHQRNEIYRSELALYRDTVRSRPGNVSAHTNLGNALRDAQRFDEAIVEYEAALKIRPNYPQAHYNLGTALSASGQMAAAISHYEDAVRLKPDYVEALNNLGIALSRAGRDVDALRHLAAAVRHNPGYAEARVNFGLVLIRAGRVAEAIGEFEQAVRLNPGFVRAHEVLGYALQLAGRGRESAAEMELAARLRAAPH